LSNYKLNYTGDEINTRLGYVTQNMAVGASPTLTGLTLSGLTANKILTSGSSKNIESSISYYNGGTNNLILGSAPASISGSYNVGFGYFSFASITSGASNTTNGYSSLYSITSGDNNTANGYGSLYSITTGDNNTASGYKSGRYTNDGGDLTTTANSCFFGYDTRASAVDNVNENVFGYAGRGNGPNTATIGNSSVIAWYMGSTKMVDQEVTTTSSPTFADVTITNGATGSFTTTDGKTVTVTSGVITAIV
jgi:hypothetical protein